MHRATEICRGCILDRSAHKKSPFVARFFSTQGAVDAARFAHNRIDKTRKAQAHYLQTRVATVPRSRSCCTSDNQDQSRELRNALAKPREISQSPPQALHERAQAIPVDTERSHYASNRQPFDHGSDRRESRTARLAKKSGLPRRCDRKSVPATRAVPHSLPHHRRARSFARSNRGERKTLRLARAQQSTLARSLASPMPAELS